MTAIAEKRVRSARGKESGASGSRTDDREHRRTYLPNLRSKSRDVRERPEHSGKEGTQTLSPKLRRPTARPPSTTVKWSHDKNVRSLAKETFGSTLTGSAMRLAAVRCRSGWVDIAEGERA